MKKLFYILFIMLVGCAKTDVVTNSTINTLNIDREKTEVSPMDTVTINEIDYISVNDLTSVLSNLEVSEDFIYSKLSLDIEQDKLVISNEEGTIIEFNFDGTINYQYTSTVESEYSGIISRGNLLDIYNKELGIVKVLTSIDYQEQELTEKTFQKSIDLNSFGLKPKYEDEVFIPVHLMSFLFNGFSHLNFSIVDDELVIFNYIEAEKIYTDKLSYSNDLNKYFLEYFKYIYNEFNFSKELYTESFNKHGEEYFTKMNKSKDYVEFYTNFNEFLYKLEDYHLYVKKYGQSVESFNSNYGLLITEHKEEGNLPKYHSLNDLRYEVRNDTLILTLDSFSSDHSSDIENLIKEHNPNNIILDIRNNGGGLVTNLYNTLSLFTNRFSFNAKDFNGNKLSLTHRFFDTFYFKGEFYLLTSELSFSTSSWFASIVKSNDIGTVIGETTLGGHTSTMPVLMPDGTILSMPIAVAAIVDEEFNYIENGVEPDIYVKDEYVEGEDMILKKALEVIEG